MLLHVVIKHKSISQSSHMSECHPVVVVALPILKFCFPAYLKYVYPQGKSNLWLPHPSKLKWCLRFLVERRGSVWARPTLACCHGTPENTKGSKRISWMGRQCKAINIRWTDDKAKMSSVQREKRHSHLIHLRDQRHDYSITVSQILKN